MQEKLRELVAELLRVDAAQVVAGTSLNAGGLQGSVGRSRLDAALRRRLGVTTPAAYAARCYGDLEASVVPGAARTDAAAASSAASTSSNGHALAQAAVARAFNGSSAAMGCGIDIELVDNLPTAEDYWQHEFYQLNFTAGEIAYCLMQEQPAMHFAARWAAKESLKKCEPSLLPRPMSELELVHYENGQTLLRTIDDGEAHPLPHAVSISHTPRAAVAVVIRPATQPHERSAPVATPSAIPSTGDVDGAASPSAVPTALWFLCGLTTVLSIAAIWFATHR